MLAHRAQSGPHPGAFPASSRTVPSTAPLQTDGIGGKWELVSCAPTLAFAASTLFLKPKLKELEDYGGVVTHGFDQAPGQLNRETSFRDYSSQINRHVFCHSGA